MRERWWSKAHNHRGHGGSQGRQSITTEGAEITEVIGGVGTLVVIALWAWMFPELRKADRMTVAELMPR